MKDKIIFLAIAIVVIISLAAISHHKNKQMENYAKTNNCTWRATGTWYGDDRDFICKKNEEISDGR